MRRNTRSCYFSIHFRKYISNRTVKNGLKAKKIKLPQIDFFLKKQLIEFSCTHFYFHSAKFKKKILTADPVL